MKLNEAIKYWGQQSRDLLPNDAGQETLECLERAKKALEFIRDLSGECIENGDVRVGTGAEVGMRHIYRRAIENL